MKLLVDASDKRGRVVLTGSQSYRLMHGVLESLAGRVGILDLSGVSDVCEAIVAATATNSRLADSVVDEVEERVRQSFGVSPLSIEGRSDGRWILIDYGSVIVHLFTPEARDFYRIERLWGDAPRIELGL